MGEKGQAVDPLHAIWNEALKRKYGDTAPAHLQQSQHQQPCAGQVEDPLHAIWNEALKRKYGDTTPAHLQQHQQPSSSSNPSCIDYRPAQCEPSTQYGRGLQYQQSSPQYSSHQYQPDSMHGRIHHGGGQMADSGYHYHSPVLVQKQRPDDPDDYTVREALVPGIIMVAASIINLICLITLFAQYTRVAEARVFEMILAVIFYAVVGILGIIGAIRSRRRAAIGIIIAASLTLVIALYQIILNITVIHSHSMTRYHLRLPASFHFRSTATIIPLVHEVVGWLCLGVCLTMIVLASRVVCRRYGMWEPRKTQGVLRSSDGPPVHPYFVPTDAHQASHSQAIDQNVEACELRESTF